ncbi:MAG: glycosyltransferase [Candidatus Heimdallarchaeaceae archaeon]
MGKLFIYTRLTGIASDRCRGIDIAERLGCPIDVPYSEITSDDTILMIKHCNAKIFDRTQKIYVDIVDGFNGGYNFIASNPFITVVTMTAKAAEYAKKTWFPNNNIIWIPHSHCNNERVVRPDREVKVVLYNGFHLGFPLEHWKIFKQKIEAQGFKARRAQTIENKNSPNLRLDCCNLYMSSDIQVSFRSSTPYKLLPLILKGPTKLNNAGSFRIPSVSYPESAFTDNHGEPGCFLPAKTIDEMVEQCVKLRDDKDLYNEIAQGAYESAQPYHIDEIIKYDEEML